MAIISSTPVYSFISTGDLTAMYTLRVMCDVIAVIDGERVAYMDDYYIQNLSTDKGLANTKGTTMSENMGLVLKSSATFDLEEIKRRKAGEVAAQREAIERMERERVVALQIEFDGQVKEGVMLCGRYTGLTAQEVANRGDIDYLVYCSEQANPTNYFKSKWLVCCSIAAEWIEANPQKPSEFVGTIGEKLEVEVTVKRASVCSGPYYNVLYIAQTDDGDMIKFFTTAKAFDDIGRGDHFKMMGTVKAQEADTYLTGNPNTTQLARVKMVK
jgi:hypothetical protein